MAAQSNNSKVLRIGIIQDGRIVQERLIKANESVTIGESAKNTFVLPGLGLPNAEFTIFAHGGKGYTLHFTNEMGGKISSNGAVVALQKLRNDPQVTKTGGVWQLPLSQQDRGKVSLGNVTVLFQFVNPPPVQAVQPIQNMDFRPRLMEEDDPIFLMFLAIWGALGMVFCIWVWNTEPREVDLEELPDRFTKLIVEEPEPPEDLELETDDAEDALQIDKSTETKPQESDKPQEAPKSEQEAAAQKQAAKEEVLQKSKLLLQVIGTTGESSGGVVADLYGDEGSGLDDLDAAIKAGVGGVTTDAAEGGFRGGSGGNGEAADIGDLAGVGGGSSGTTGGPALVANVSSNQGNLDLATGDAGSVKKTVQRYGGQVKYCYEQRLKANPSVEGRVEMGWAVFGGRVESVYTISNGTGDQELAKCIQGKIKRWKFPDEIEGDVSYTWVLRPSGG